jgi:hypothetical protein
MAVLVTMFVCEVELQPKTGNVTGHNRNISVEGREKESKPDAMERAAKAAILTLERAMSIFLIDINYNKRSHAEVQVAKAEYVLNLISIHFSEVLSEWIKEVDKVSACQSKDPCRPCSANPL